MSNRIKVILAIIVVSLLWSTAGTAKILLRSFDPFTAAFFRFLIAFVTILPFFLKERTSHKHRLLLLIPVVLLSTGNMAFFLYGS